MSATPAKKVKKSAKRIRTEYSSDEDLAHVQQGQDVKPEDTILGFTDLGHREEEEEVIEEPLPTWMKNPNSIPDSKVPLADLSPSINEKILDNLRSLGFTEFFPVQRELLPILSRPRIFGGDLCISAPTGSGKTLTYVIPIVQDLMNRIVARTRAVVIVPNRDLVQQAKAVFDDISKGTDLRTRAWLDYEDIYRSRSNFVFSKRQVDDDVYDIWISTPDGLMQQLENNPKFDLQHLRYLVMDEADQLLDNRLAGKNSANMWIEKLLSACYKTTRSYEGEIATLRERNPARFNPKAEPLYKVLLSATMSKNPAELAYLQLVNPQFYTTSVLYTLPSTLKQYIVYSPSLMD